MGSIITYRAKSDCLVFGHYRNAGEVFTAPAWKKEYKWPMPDFLELVGEENVPEPAETPADVSIG